ncbi:hypothetical protein HYY71_05245 [Candidatus Woesearchaeota archaeon]|nr:hypothetical protein [Candidatus Woesearchaeota archaeon]
MATKRISERIKKNLLDMEYHKYLQYYNTSVIILFTYFIAVVIAFVTKQIDYSNLRQLMFVGLLSIGFVGLIIFLMLKLKENLTRIPKEIKKLKL